MVKVFSYGKMETNTMENTNLIKPTVKELCPIQTEINILESGKTEKKVGRVL